MHSDIFCTKNSKAFFPPEQQKLGLFRGTTVRLRLNVSRLNFIATSKIYRDSKGVAAAVAGKMHRENGLTERRKSGCCEGRSKEKIWPRESSKGLRKGRGCTWGESGVHLRGNFVVVDHVHTRCLFSFFFRNPLRGRGLGGFWTTEWSNRRRPQSSSGFKQGCQAVWGRLH